MHDRLARLRLFLAVLMCFALGGWTQLVGAQERVVQAPASDGAQAISGTDRVYTADQVSNTVSVIDPSTNTLLGTIPLGAPRSGPLLSPIYFDEIDVHGLGFSPDGALIDAISVTTNSATLIDPTTNTPVGRAYVGRAPHEGFISPDGKELWVAERGEGSIIVLDVATLLAAGAAGEPAAVGTGDVGIATPEAPAVIERISTGKAPSMVVFSPDGRFAYVNHSEVAELVKIDVDSHEVVDRLTGLVSPFSPNLAVSPDGEEIWLTHKDVGMVTVVDADDFVVLAVLKTGPVTNHVTFVTTPDVAYAYVTVGGMDQTLVFERNGATPEKVAEIKNSGSTPHGIWPSPDNSRVYVGLENADAVDVIDTAAMEVVATIKTGQSPQALVYVANAVPTGAGADNLTMQGVGLRIETLAVETPDGGMANAFVRELPTTDQIEVTGSGLTPGALYSLVASGSAGEVVLADLEVKPNGTAAMTVTLRFFGQFDRVQLRPTQG